jgi:hypothetical protein
MTPTLYLVQIDGLGLDPRAEAIAAAGEADLHELAPGLFLVRSARTRSQLYHALKRRFAPDRLLVAPLSAAPKFKGMAPGALAWLRARGHR